MRCLPQTCFTKAVTSALHRCQCVYCRRNPRLYRYCTQCWCPLDAATAQADASTGQPLCIRYCRNCSWPPPVAAAVIVQPHCTSRDFAYFGHALLHTVYHKLCNKTHHIMHCNKDIASISYFVKAAQRVYGTAPAQPSPCAFTESKIAHMKDQL